MWIWNTNIYFWQQWPVYLHDRNDHGLIGCSRQLSAVLPGLLHTTGRHTRAPTAPTALPPCCQHLPLQAQQPGSPFTHSPGSTACPSPTRQSQEALEDASSFPFPSHRFLQLSHPTFPLSQPSCPTARLAPGAGTHLSYSSRYQRLHALTCWAPDTCAQITQSTWSRDQPQHWGSRAAAAWAVSTSTCPWLTHSSQSLLPSCLVTERLPGPHPHQLCQDTGVPGSPGQGTPVSGLQQLPSHNAPSLTTFQAAKRSQGSRAPSSSSGMSQAFSAAKEQQPVC